MNLPGFITSEDAVNGCLARLGATNETAGDHRHALRAFFYSIQPAFYVEFTSARRYKNMLKKRD
jgi:hypothetical protein